jgi:hypothetical protein
MNPDTNQSYDFVKEEIQYSPLGNFLLEKKYLIPLPSESRTEMMVEFKIIKDDDNIVIKCGISSSDKFHSEFFQRGDDEWILLGLVDGHYLLNNLTENTTNIIANCTYLTNPQVSQDGTVLSVRSHEKTKQPYYKFFDMTKLDNEFISELTVSAKLVYDELWKGDYDPDHRARWDDNCFIIYHTSPYYLYGNTWYHIWEVPTENYNSFRCEYHVDKVVKIQRQCDGNFTCQTMATTEFRAIMTRREEYIRRCNNEFENYVRNDPLFSGIKSSLKRDKRFKTITYSFNHHPVKEDGTKNIDACIYVSNMPWDYSLDDRRSCQITWKYLPGIEDRLSIKCHAYSREETCYSYGTTPDDIEDIINSVTDFICKYQNISEN